MAKFHIYLHNHKTYILACFMFMWMNCETGYAHTHTYIHLGDSTPLMEAASGGYADIVKLLIDHGAKVNAKSRYCTCTRMHKHNMLLQCSVNLRQRLYHIQEFAYDIDLLYVSNQC